MWQHYSGKFLALCPLLLVASFELKNIQLDHNINVLKESNKEEVFKEGHTHMRKMSYFGLNTGSVLLLAFIVTFLESYFIVLIDRGERYLNFNLFKTVNLIVIKM